MTSYCYEMEEQFNPSAHYGELAIGAGEKLPEDQRAQSTLAYVGDGLIRVIKTAKKKRKARGLPEEWEVEDRRCPFPIPSSAWCSTPWSSRPSSAPR